MSMFLSILNDQAITGTLTDAAILTNASPFLDGHNALMKVSALGGTPTIIIETAGDAAFTVGVITVATLNAANNAVGKTLEITLQKYIRRRQTAAGTGNATIHLEGVQ